MSQVTAQSRSVLWVEKYRPRRLSEIVDIEEAKKKVVEWIKQWLSGKIPEKKAILLVGPPGVGKTTLAHAVANEFGLEVLELNASDVRTGERLRQIIGKAMKEASLFGFRGRLILLDEVDGLHAREDAGGLSAIIELVQETRWPIIMTANNPWDPKFKQLREIAEVIQIKPLSEDDIVLVLRRICNAEGIKCEEDALRLIARASGGDLRAAINDLQSVAQGKKVLTKEDVLRLSDRAHQYDMYRILDKAFRIRRMDEVRQITFLPSFDWEAFFPWAAENVAIVYEKYPSAMADAYDNLSMADVFRGRILRTQEWELMPYMTELMVGGIALVKNKPSLPRFIRFQFPQKLLILSRTKELREQREAFINRLRLTLHVSSRIITTEYLPLIRFLIKHDKEFARKFIEYLVKHGYSVDTIEKILNIELPKEEVKVSTRSRKR
ncbi:MAG: replication factor C large subunit [Crenarchaeota archaeon]|nr:replication factor C large subunit [Thermoproteota archaeon]